MPQAQVTMDVRKVNERLFTYSPTEHYRNVFQTFCGVPRCDLKSEQLKGG